MQIDCNCIEDLGCFVSDPTLEPAEQIIDLGIAAFCAGTYRFIVSYRGRKEIVDVDFVVDDNIVLPNIYDETAEIFIKVQIPEDCRPVITNPRNAGINFLTSAAGACVWKIKNGPTTC